MTQLNPLKLSVKLSINNTNQQMSGIFGRGAVSLLKGVKSYGSLNQAAKSMNMAYSKAWRLIKEAEAHLGVKLIERQGAHGSFLTPEGDHMLEIYTHLEEEVLAMARNRFEELLKEKMSQKAE